MLAPRAKDSAGRAALFPGVNRFGHVCPLSHFRNPKKRARPRAKPGHPGDGWAEPKTPARRRATKKYLPSRPARGMITAVATVCGRPCGRRPQTNDADEPSDAIERRLRRAEWPVDLSPPIDPERSAIDSALLRSACLHQKKP